MAVDYNDLNLKKNKKQKLSSLGERKSDIELKNNNKKDLCSPL